MTQRPTVSIILPNHNYADFVADAIVSVKNQTFKDFECIIIDDASDDGSVQIIEKLIAGDLRFKLIKISEAIGVAAARNIGLDAATGEYIAFLDSDDCYVEHTLEALVKLAQNTNADMAGGYVVFINGHFKWQPRNVAWHLNDLRVYDNCNAMLKPSKNNKWVWIWRRIYKRSFIGDTRFHSDMKINGEDLLFMLDIAWRVKTFAETETPVIYHRIHPLSITSTDQKFNPERVRVFPTVFKHIHDDLLDKYDDYFFKKLYPDLFSYMLSECFLKTAGDVETKHADFLREILSESCKNIPRKYLPFKQRMLCWYLSWKK